MLLASQFSLGLAGLRESQLIESNNNGPTETEIVLKSSCCSVHLQFQIVKKYFSSDRFPRLWYVANCVALYLALVCLAPQLGD